MSEEGLMIITDSVSRFNLESPVPGTALISGPSHLHSIRLNLVSFVSNEPYSDVSSALDAPC